MQAVILAGGVGSRVQALSGGAPKCLIEIGGRPIILHQLEMLADHGVGPVIVVLGYRAEDVKKVVGDRAQTVVNERYAETNSLYSLSLAKDLITGPFLLLNSDLFFDPTILNKLLRESGSALVYDSTSSRGREQTKVVVRDRRVVDLGKDLPTSATRGESLGLVKFDEQGAHAMLEATDHLIRDGHTDAWVIEGTRSVLSQVKVTGVNVAGLPWAEIDFPHDLDVARREVWPRIYRRRWLTQARWRRARYLALAAAVALVALSGWYANSRVGPASKDWETVPLATDSIVALRRGDRVQPWALARLGDAVTGRATSTQISVETRLVLPRQVRSEYKYVIAVVVDGEPATWKAHTTRRDTLAHSPVGAVGKRERVKLDLPGGAHRVAVRLIDGHGIQMLVRLRERDLVDDEG